MAAGCGRVLVDADEVQGEGVDAGEAGAVEGDSARLAAEEVGGEELHGYLWKAIAKSAEHIDLDAEGLGREVTFAIERLQVLGLRLAHLQSTFCDDEVKHGAFLVDKVAGKVEAIEENLAEDEAAGGVVEFLPGGHVGVGDLGADVVVVSGEAFAQALKLVLNPPVGEVEVPADEIVERAILRGDAIAVGRVDQA